MDIMQRQSSTDFEDLDGSDFDSCDDEDIYDCPEQGNTYQVERPGDADGQEEGDEIYDTPDDAREQLAALNSVSDQQHFSNHPNGHQVAASDQLDQSSQSTSIANARAFFANKVNTSSPHPGVPVKPKTKPAIAQKWPPPKTEGLDVEAENPRSSPQYNEKHRAIFNKLSRVIGDGTSWERNNNASGNDLDQRTSNKNNGTVNIHPGIVDRSDRPHLKDSHSRVQPVMKPSRNIPNGKHQTAAFEAPQDEGSPRPPYPNGLNRTPEIEDEEEQYVEPLSDSTAVDAPSFQSHSQISNMPKPVSERQPNRTMNYADIIIDPVPRAQRLPKNNATAVNALRNPSMQQNYHSTPEPFSEENYEVTASGEAPVLPSGRPNMDKPGNFPRVHSSSGKQVFTPSNKPRAVPVSENAPVLPPGGPNRRDPGMPPGHLPGRLVAAPVRGTQAQDPSQENYEVPGSSNAPALLPSRLDRRERVPGAPSGHPPGREGFTSPIATQPQEVCQENYEVPGSSNPPSLPPGRPARKGPGISSGHLPRREGFPLQTTAQPQDVSQENYEVPDSGNPPALPPNRLNKTGHRIPPGQPSSGKVFLPQNIAPIQDLAQENYEVADSANAPKLPPDRLGRGFPSIPPSQPSRGQGFHPQNMTQTQGSLQENYEVPGTGSPPEIPPDRPNRGGPGTTRGCPSSGKGSRSQSNTQPQDISQENYEVPDAGSPPEIPPDRPNRGGPGITHCFPSNGKGSRPQSNTQPQDLSQENYEVPDAGSPPEIPPDRPNRGGPGITRGFPSSGKGSRSQSNTQPQDISQENYEVPDAGSPPELPPDRPNRGGPGITRGFSSSGKGSRSQSNTQPQDISQENYEVPDAGSPPELPPDRPNRGGPGITRGFPSSGKGSHPQSNAQQQNLSQENYEVPDAGSPPELPPDRLNRGGPGITRGFPSSGKGSHSQSNAQQQGLSQENYEVPDVGNAPGIPPDRPSRFGSGIPPGRKSSGKGFPFQHSTETQDLSQENYEVPDAGDAPAVPRDRAHKGAPGAQVNKNPVIPTKPKTRSLKNLFHSSKKQPRCKPSKLIKEKQDVQEPQSAGSSSGCSEFEQENYEVMDGQPQEDYEIVDQTPSDKVQSGRCPPDGQEHRGGIAKPKRTFSPEDQMLNHVLVGLTNPQQVERQQQPVSRKERPPSVRVVPPRPSDSDKPLLDLHELANATIEPSSQSSPVKPPKPTMEQEPWYFCSIDRPGAERKLNGVQKDGAFIVRKNSNGDGYSISIYYKGDIRHLKIGKKGSGYHLGTSEKSFECVQDLISYFKSFPIELKQGGKTKLTVTAPKG